MGVALAALALVLTHLLVAPPISRAGTVRQAESRSRAHPRPSGGPLDTVLPVPPPKVVVLTERVRFDRITMDSGLSHSFVRAIAEDRRGFMWLGTVDGLNRFDGYRMTVFRRDPVDPDSMGASQVSSILEDRAGMLWLAHASMGVTRFNPVDESFKTYRHEPDDPNSLAGDVIFNIFQDDLGRIWFSGPPEAGGLTYLDPGTGRFTRIDMGPEPVPDAYRGGLVWDAVEDGGHMWLAADFLVEELDPKTGRFTHYFPPHTERRLGAIVRDDDGNVWAGGFNGIYRVDRRSKKLVPQKLGVTRVSSIVVDHRGRFWIGTDHGLYVAGAGMRGIVQHFTHDARDPTTLPSQRIRQLYWSRSGLLWIATEQGIGTYHESQNRFVNLGLPSDESTSEPGTGSMSVARDGNLWMMHEGRIERIDLVSRTAEVFDFAPVLEGGSSPSRIYADGHGAVWFAVGEHVLRFDVRRGELHRLELPRPVTPDVGRVPRKGPPAVVVDFVEDDSGTIWIAAVRAGLFFWDRTSNRIEAPRESTAYASASGYPDVFHVATSLVVSRSGTLWVGTQTGELLGVDTRRRRLTREFAPGDYPSLPASQINAIHEDRNNDLWLGTQVGLVHAHVDPAAPTPTFELYGQRKGLDSPAVETILEDDARCLWLGTRKGLVRFDPDSGRFRRFDADDGLPGNALLSGGWLGESGRLAFADPGGVTLFRPRSLTASEYRPPLLLTGFQLMYEAQRPGRGGVLDRPIWDTDEVRLDYQQNVFGFEFTALDYISPHKNRYRYRLEGFDDRWHESDSEHRFATYTHVPPGDYRFRVERRTGDGEWPADDASTSIRLTVGRPWWMTLWARGAFLAALTGMVFGWHRARLGRVRKLNVLLEAKVAQRTAELEEANRRLALAATTDPLTGVPNRRHYLERAQLELAKRKRSGRALTVALADVDDFKRINDAFGHENGDQVLRRVAETLRAQVREQDIVARWGGEEFIFLFPETDVAGASIIAEKIRARIEATPFHARGKEIRVTMTIGIAEVSANAPIEEATARADEALYGGKHQGKNRVVADHGDDRVPLSSVEEETGPGGELSSTFALRDKRHRP